MKILRLKSQGYRSLKQIDWQPGDLNVVIGPNGSGKSNLLRLLELISVSAKGELGKYIQRAGGMEPLVWDGQAEEINYCINTSPIETRGDITKDCLTYEVELKRIGKTSSYRINNEILAKPWKYEQGFDYEPHTLLERKNLYGKVFENREKHWFVTEEIMNEEETLLSLTKGPFTANHLIPPFGFQLSTWCIYHDFHVHQDAKIRQPVIAKSEKHVESDGQNLISVLHTLYTENREFKKEIDLAMHAAFGDDYEELIFPPAADQRIQLRVRWKSLRREQSAADLSDGTLRFLFLLTVFCSPSPAPIIVIDEPETGLHPSMLPIVAEHAVDASQRVQVIITTHSPQFLDAFEDVQPTTTIAKWENGETILKILDGEELKYWLHEYSLGSLFRSGELEEIL